MSLITHIDVDFIKKIIQEGVSKCTIAKVGSIDNIININIDKESKTVEISYDEKNTLTNIIITIDDNKISEIITSTIKETNFVSKRYKVYEYQDINSDKLISYNSILQFDNRNNSNKTEYKYDKNDRLVEVVLEKDNLIKSIINFKYFYIDDCLCYLSSDGLFKKYDNNERLIYMVKMYKKEKFKKLCGNMEIKYEYDDRGNIIKKSKIRTFRFPTIDTYKTECNITYNKHNLPVTMIYKKDAVVYKAIKYNYEY